MSKDMDFLIKRVDELTEQVNTHTKCLEVLTPIVKEYYDKKKDGKKSEVTMFG